MTTKGARKNRVRRVVRKLELIIASGGSCRLCGYNKNISSLVFHHVREKFMSLSGRHISATKMSDARKEAKRCVLLCHNCHNELHNPHLTLDNLYKLRAGIKSGVFELEEAFDYLFIFKNKKP